MDVILPGVLSGLLTERLSNPIIDLEKGELPTEKTLGLHWDCEKDTFIFKIDFKHTASKSEILRAVTSIHDPLGFIAPITFKAKRIIQKAWQLNLEWDDPIPPKLGSRWETWGNKLSWLKNLHIPRCFKPRSEVPSEVSLHICCDASKKGFGTVVYIRIRYNTTMNISLVAAKSSVALLKGLIIPRLRFQGAVLGLRLSEVIRKEIRGKIDYIKFWVDSTTVLNWIHAKTFKFHEFVSNSISEILERSHSSQWRHIPGRLNPADEASRGLSACELIEHHRWFRGPDFLIQSEENWPPRHRTCDPSADDPEIKPMTDRHVAAVISKSPFPMDTILTWCSRTWSSLRRATCF